VRLASAAVVLALAVAVLVLAPGRASDGRSTSPASGPEAARVADSPLLSAAEGVLWWVSDRCGTGKLVLAERRIVTGPPNHCGLYPSPDGATVLATQRDPDPPSPPGRVVVMDASFRVTALTTIRADSVYPPISWAPGSALATVCELRADGLRQTVVVDGSGSARVLLPGLCRPAYLSDDAVAATDRQNVYVGQTRLRIQPILARSIATRPGRYSVEALAGHRDTLLVSVANLDGSLVGAPGAIVAFDRRSGATRTFPVTRGGYANELGISPDATSFWYRGGGTGDSALVSNGRVLARSIPRVGRAFAWSPDGSMLAVARDSGLEIYELASGRHVTIDVRNVARLSWTL